MMRARVSMLVTIVLVAAGLTACGPGEPPRPDPQVAADELARQLTSGTFSAELLGETGAADEFAAILGDLAELPRKVTAGVVLEEGELPSGEAAEETDDAGPGQPAEETDDTGATTGSMFVTPGSSRATADGDDERPESTDERESVTVPLTWTFEIGEDQELTYETVATLRLEIPTQDDNGADAPEQGSTSRTSPGGTEMGTPQREAAGDAASPAASGTATEAPHWVSQWDPTIVHPDATATSTFETTTLHPVRGDIVTTEGTPLVTMRDVWRVGIDKMNLPDAAEQEAAARELAARLEIDPDAFAAQVVSAGERAFVVAITIRQSEAEEWDADGLRTIPGVLFQSATIPLGPTAAFARPVLGTVGEATAEIIENSDGAIQPGDLVGFGGLESAYDADLRGGTGHLIELTDSDAGEPVEILRNDPINGEPLVVTLEESMQLLAEDLLSTVEGPSAIAAIRPSDGHVLVLASGPGSAGYNTAALGQYAAGSTFKVATALTLLRNGYTADSELDCTPTSTVDGRAFTNYPGFPESQLGMLPLHTQIAHSCNTALINEASAFTAADLASTAATLGIGTPGPWAFPYFSGTIPDDAVGTSHAASLIGQGGVLVSPLAMASVAASVAAGETVVPVLVPEIEHEAAPASGTVALSPGEAEALRAMMREVVTGGTGSILQGVPGEPVSAKSGTAEWVHEGEPAIHGWMIAYQGDLAVAAFVEQADVSGSRDAGPLVRDFLARITP